MKCIFSLTLLDLLEFPLKFGIDLSRVVIEMMIINNTTDVPTIVAPSVTVFPTTVHPSFVPHGEKLEKFSGIDFKRWQQKILFNLIP